MGTRMAPLYANLFMADLEQKLLTWTTRPYVWWRFIDDIFAIWQHDEESLTSFLLQINSFHPTIRFTSEIFKEHLSFLDTRMEGLSTQIYTPSRPTPTNIYPWRAAIPNTAPHQSHTGRALGSNKSAPRRTS